MSFSKGVFDESFEESRCFHFRQGVEETANEMGCRIRLRVLELVQDATVYTSASRESGLGEVKGGDQ